MFHVWNVYIVIWFFGGYDGLRTNPFVVYRILLSPCQCTENVLQCLMVHGSDVIIFLWYSRSIFCFEIMLIVHLKCIPPLVIQIQPTFKRLPCETTRMQKCQGCGRACTNTNSLWVYMRRKMIVSYIYLIWNLPHCLNTHYIFLKYLNKK